LVGVVAWLDFQNGSSLGAAMVDRLKRSLEQLDTPICPKCSIEMKWSRSTLLNATTVAHVFVCPSCSRVEEAKSKVNATDTPPEKLSAPYNRHAA
jgi:predicted RNA-binding Zn-ribbon protein involved in translation (DUF1610 family)